MPRFPHRDTLRALLLTCCCGCLLPAAARGEEFSPEQLQHFETRVRPVLAEHCYDCHGAEKQQNGLRLDSRAAVLKGGDYGPVAVPGQPEQSKLIKALRHAEGVEAMPKKADKLPDAAIGALEDWIRQGLPWPAETASAKVPPSWRKHWAFQPVTDPPAPAVKDASLLRQPMDAYVLARLEKENLTFSPVADRAALIRRAFMDLTGLPPSFADVGKFMSDASPDAWPKLVDSLLASPHFGERWARRWMDLARYADTKGYVFQEERRYAYAYTYRDWLVGAFNRDLPYDQFLIKQMAADLTTDAAKDPADLAAMGFLTLGRRFLNSQPDIIDDRIDVVFRGTQGLTVSCARCHDHKFDPIPTADYYSLYGVFNSSVEPEEKPLLGEPEDSPELRAYQKTLAEKEAALQAYRRLHPRKLPPRPLYDLAFPYQQRQPFFIRHRDELNRLKTEVEQIKASSPAAPPRAMVMVDKPQPVEPVIFQRGNAGRPGPQVPRRFLEALSPEGERPNFTKGSGRLEMAQDIASAENPLTARVFVNRVWAWLYGVPLVDSQSDFGVRTPRPDNPELLDHLAARFMAEGWSMKKLIRHILLSTTWQQSSQTRPDALAKDPENRLHWRQNRRRLDFEAFRDSLLSVSGGLDPAMGGRGTELVTDGAKSRRTLYGLIDRQNLPGIFRTFDLASPDATAPKRFETTVPQQALFMMNSPFVEAQAERLAAAAGKQPDPAAVIRQLYLTILSREPEAEEIQLGLACLKDLQAQPRQTGSDWRNGWGQFDPRAGKVTFTPFPYFQKDRWSGSAQFPDPALGHLILHPKSGHPGGDAAHAVIRRWTAPEAATVRLGGKVSLPAKQSGGIIAGIVHSRKGLLGLWPVPPAGEVEAAVHRVVLEPGDTLDFILDCDGDPNSDSFNWDPVITDTTTGIVTAQASADFGGPGLPALAVYAQALLCSNEFLYLD
ncbi:MAG: PSD1 and planctomycete cytochrome C domain-containing protein [Verrucomicrobiota bacterium]